MPFEREEMEERTRLKIQGALSIYDAAALREELLDCLKRDRDLELDLKRVTNCDTAGLQLLYAVRKTASAAGQTVRIENPSQPVQDTLLETGLRAKDFD